MHCIGTYYWQLHDANLQWALDHAWTYFMFRDYPHASRTCQATLPDYETFNFED